MFVVGAEFGLLLGIVILCCLVLRWLDLVIDENAWLKHDIALLHADVLKILRKEEAIMASNQDILAEVAAQSTIEDSILALVQRLVAENDPAARQAILDGLVANRGKLEAAVLAGTPQAPTP